ncbi:ATP-dependent Clp protease adapter ClpS [Ruficoccus amylovorans]|uniref:ATP-dependent Clp protease adapter protein ClpS n=1 Tax=Ruficoccus amylovorans TaxID=1804625 RepID=A0A842HEU7_9BACT|nr:ATP-dependent Clp protease adapter ClpS [Ruficoccus amylovorans]MBC2594750.1 ATP-dependent Clp protease adapter ClpS [Ruficoccus amylovorans]
MAQTSHPLAAPKTQTQTEADLPWLVVVMNDPVNLMDYVVMVFRRVFGYDLAKARKHMLEVHEEGRSVLWSGSREQAEAYVYQLQEWQLSAKLQRDSGE